jgi:predicted  nucleic acid-binding Zn-ribbon protein
VTNSSFHLFQLQKIDLRLDQIDARINKITDLIEHNQALQDADLLVKNAESDVAKKDQEISELDSAVRAKTIKIEQSESVLYKGTNQSPKELGDLQKEIASLKRSLTGLEEEQFAKLSEFESLNEQLNQHKNTFSAIKDEWQSSNQTLVVEMESLKKEKEKLATERQVVTGQILAEQLSLYEKLRISKNHIAVTSIDDESCTICGSEISAANIQKAKSSISLITCPSCGRIIYSG